LLPTPELTAQATANDGFFLGVHLDRATAPLVLGDQAVRFLPATAQAGDTTIVLNGQAAWDAASWWMTVGPAEMTSAPVPFTAQPPVRLSGGASGGLFGRLIAHERGAHRA